MNYEKAYQELQKIVSQLESGSIKLSTLPNKVKRAGELIQYCKEQLRGIESDLKMIAGDEEE